MKFKKMIFAVLMAIVLLAITACGNQLDLSLKGKPGDSYVFKINTTTVAKRGEKEQAVEEKQSADMEYTMNVEKVDAKNNMSVKYTYNSFKMGADEIIYDSKKIDENNPNSKLYGAIVGKSFNVTMNSKGEVSKVDGMDQLFNAMTESEENEGLKAQMKAEIKSVFGDEAIKSMLQQTTRILPAQKVGVGDTWEVNHSIKSIVPLELKAVYTLEKVEGDEAIIAVKAEIKTDPNKEAKIDGIKVKSGIQGTLTGKYRVNKNNAFIVKGEINQKMSGDMAVNLNGEEIKFPIEIQSKMTYSTEKK